MHPAAGFYLTRHKGKTPLRVRLPTLTLWLPASEDDSAKNDRAAELDRLIEGLVSRNKQPPIVPLKPPDTIKHGSVWNFVETDRAPLFSKDYSWADQERVLAALKKLEGIEGEELWPRLVEHSKDMRYSLTCIDCEDPVNLTVGKLCWWMAHNDLLCVYQEFGGANVLPGDYPESSTDGFTRKFYPILVHPYNLDDEVYYDRGTRKGEDLRTWYGARAGKPLYELQIEVCGWVTQKVQKLDDVPEKPRSEFLSHVKEQIEILRRTRKPITCRHLPITGGRAAMIFQGTWACMDRNDYARQQNEIHGS